jgi:deferrochelatase/peroxidase EfeB
MTSPQPGGLSRRRFLASGVGVGAGISVGAGATLTSCAASAGAPGQARFVPFEGVHQNGVTALPVPARGLMAAFTVQSSGRPGLSRLFAALTDEIRGLMAGRVPQVRDPAFPPVDSGVLGANPPPDNLSVVVSVGASLFDDRFGLADRKPRELVTMPFVSNDRLDPARSHGDVLLSLEAGHPDTLQFALRQLTRRTRSDLVLHWLIDGFSRGSATAADGGTQRNLMGFKDGTANLDPNNAQLMDRFVWIGDGDGEPAWAVGGSYHVVRVIRMFVEFWDRTPLAEQEAIFGRHKLNGAPLGRDNETDEPDYGTGKILPTAHIRLANPRTLETAENLILRRGFSFARGFDGSGQLDQGLAFVCYQRSLSRGFLAVQNRLTGEPLEEYILPVGGGFFFALPGVDGPGRFLGDALVS